MAHVDLSLRLTRQLIATVLFDMKRPMTAAQIRTELRRRGYGSVFQRDADINPIVYSEGPFDLLERRVIFIKDRSVIPPVFSIQILSDSTLPLTHETVGRDDHSSDLVFVPIVETTSSTSARRMRRGETLDAFRRPFTRDTPMTTTTAAVAVPTVEPASRRSLSPSAVVAAASVAPDTPVTALSAPETRVESKLASRNIVWILIDLGHCHVLQYVTEEFLNRFPTVHVWAYADFAYDIERVTVCGPHPRLKTWKPAKGGVKHHGEAKMVHHVSQELGIVRGTDKYPNLVIIGSKDSFMSAYGSVLEDEGLACVYALKWDQMIARLTSYFS